MPQRTHTPHIEPPVQNHSTSAFAAKAESHEHKPSRRAYKIHEAAEILGITSISVRRLIDRGLLRPCRALRHVLVPVDEIERLLKN